jgi:hypothetical protein
MPTVGNVYNPHGTVSLGEGVVLFKIKMIINLENK